MKPPFTLVEQPLSHDVVQALEHLLEAARKRKVIGLAYVAMCKNRSYYTNTAGEANRNPTFARGMVAALDDELSQRVRG